MQRRQEIELPGGCLGETAAGIDGVATLCEACANIGWRERAVQIEQPSSRRGDLGGCVGSAVGKAVSAASVSAKVGLSAAYTQKFLRALDEKDYVERQESKFLRVSEIMIEAEVVVSVEAKLKKWRQALGQAKRYQYFSNIVFVALPQAVVRNIDRNLFRRENIGVIQVSEDGAEVLMKPQRIKPRSEVMHQYCCQSLFAGRLGAFAGASV